MKCWNYPMTVGCRHFVHTRTLAVRAARDCCPNSYALLVEHCNGDVKLADEVVRHWREAHTARQMTLIA